MEVIDNFLPEEEFLFLQKEIVFNSSVPFFLSDAVALDSIENIEDGNWNWYGAHLLYFSPSPCSSYYDMVYEVLVKKLIECDKAPFLRALLRMKINFYPFTCKLKEHHPHYDYDFDHTGCIFSLNTCDGYTKLEDGTKIDSVANRILIFDSSKLHSSTTTTNQKGRFNININYV